MDKMKVWKQGVELEINVIEKTKPFGTKNYDLHLFIEEKLSGNVSSRIYFDDNKPEFPSLPFETLPELEGHLIKIFDEIFDVLDQHNCYISLLGCYPFFRDYCSGHIHTSILNYKEDSWLEMRRKLYNAQPLLALLSANSPVQLGEYLGSDVRLMFSSWATPVEYEDNCSSHWMALAKGRKGPTLECRIPSAGPLFQILGIANIIRVLLEDNDSDIPVLNAVDLFKRTAKYGTDTIVPIRLPKKITYKGIDYRVVDVKLVDLWRVYFEDNKDLIKENIKDCKTYKEIMLFYESLANGVSVSDRMLGVWENTKREEISKTIDAITRMSYESTPVLESLPLPNNKMHTPDIPITLEEFKKIVESVRIPDIKTYPSEKDIESYLLSIDLEEILPIFNKLQKGEVSKRMFLNRTLKELQDLNVIRVNGDLVEKADNYNYVIQILEDLL